MKPMTEEQTCRRSFGLRTCFFDDPEPSKLQVAEVVSYRVEINEKHSQQRFSIAGWRTPDFSLHSREQECDEGN